LPPTNTGQAETVKQWEAAARELDAIERNNDWKNDLTAGDYNPKLIEERLRELDNARTNCDIRTMMYLIRTALSRDLGGMGSVDLYRHSHIGTKRLIERYVDSTIATINAVVTQGALDQSIDPRELLEGMLFSRQSFGRSALLLSGGGTFGMSHIGVAKALFEAKLLPRIISGASAGSIVSAVLCTRTDEEVPELLRSFPHGDLAVFEDAETPDGMLDHMRRLLTEGSWSDIKHLSRVMRTMTADLTFQEAYNRSRRILNICVSPESVYELPRLLNYVTAPNVMIWSAVAASCSVPLIFNSSPLLAKDPATGEHRPWNPSPQLFIDGSVDNDLPMTRLSELFNVNHFIVSQVNPHVSPFLPREDYAPVDQVDRPWLSYREDLEWLYTITSLAKEEALHRLHFMAELGIMPNLVTKFQSILSQKYSGDINILPEISMQDLPRLLANPSTEFMQRTCLIGERATWPKLSRIRDQCAIELALDRAVHRLRTRVVFAGDLQESRKVSASTANLKLSTSMAESTMELPINDEDSSKMSMKKRSRTHSGGSLQILPIRRMLLEDDAFTDEDTAEEERLEMQARTGRAASVATVRTKPRLKGNSKSHTHIPSIRSSFHSPTARPEKTPVVGFPDYDFSKPMTPPSRRASAAQNILARLPAVVDSTPPESTPATHSPLQTVPSRAGVPSPTEDMETSENEPSSDADAEQATEESDPDLSEAQERLKSSLPMKPANEDEPEKPPQKDGGLWE
jgi:TAG lipase/steryl ester hydrolase/phospholipase A2/LPA acyltransferase